MTYALLYRLHFFFPVWCGESVGSYVCISLEYIERGRFCCSGRRRPKADLFLLTPLPFASTKNKPSVCTGGVVCADRTDRD